MRNTLETRLGLFFALTLIAAFVIMEMVGGGNLFRKTIPVRARFGNIQQLQVGDPVKMGGFTIGEVKEIKLANTEVEVMMLIDPEAEVKTSSLATIKFIGLMGQNYISVTFGTPEAPKIMANAELETEEQPDLSALMSRIQGVAEGVEGLTKSFSTENFSDLLGPLTDFLTENRPRLNTLFSNLQHISTEIAQGRGTVGKLIADETLYHSALGTVTNLNATATDIQSTIDQARLIVEDLRAGRGTLGRLTTDEKLYTETTEAMVNLRQVLEKINQGQGSVGVLVNDPSFIKNARLTLQKVDKATESLEDQGPLSVIGLAVGQLF